MPMKKASTSLIPPTTIHLDDTVKVFDIELTDEDVRYLDELYIPHPITCNR